MKKPAKLDIYRLRWLCNYDNSERVLGVRSIYTGDVFYKLKSLQVSKSLFSLLESARYSIFYGYSSSSYYGFCNHQFVVFRKLGRIIKQASKSIPFNNTEG